MPSESFIAVPPDSTGKNVRNLSIQTQGTDGSYSTVQMQVVSIADEFGNPIWQSNDDMFRWRNDLLDEIRALRLMMQTRMDQGCPMAEQEDYLSLAKAWRDQQEQIEV